MRDRVLHVERAIARQIRHRGLELIREHDPAVHQAQPMDAGHAVHDARVLFRTRQQLRDNLREIANPRRHRLLQDARRKLGRSAQLVLDEPVDPAVDAAQLEHPMQQPTHEEPQPLFGIAALRRRHRETVELTDRRDRLVHYLEIESQLVAEVIVDERQIRSGPATDLSHRHVLEATLGEQMPRCVEQACARLRDVGTAGCHVPSGAPFTSRSTLAPSHRTHSSRLNRNVAAAMVTTENPIMYVRSDVIAAKPVSLRSTLLSAWTGYENGSTTASACSHGGNACCCLLYTSPSPRD